MLDNRITVMDQRDVQEGAELELSGRGGERVIEKGVARVIRRGGARVTMNGRG